MISFYCQMIYGKSNYTQQKVLQILRTDEFSGVNQTV